MSTWKIAGGGVENSFDFANPEESSSLLINGYVDDNNNTIKAPGKDLFIDFTPTIKAAFATVSHPIDGIYFWRAMNKLIVIAGPKDQRKVFYAILTGTPSTAVCAGAIVLSSEYSPTFVDGLWAGRRWLFIACGGKITVLDDTAAPVVTQFDNATYAGIHPPEDVSHVATLNGYLLMNSIGTPYIYVTTDPLSPFTVITMATSYFVCEYRPDNILAFTVYNREVVVFGGQSIEVWYDDGTTGSSTVPSFVRNNSACYDIGITSSQGFFIIQGVLYFMDTLQQVRKIENRSTTIISDSYQKYLADIKTTDMRMCGGFVEGRPCLFLIFPSAEKEPLGTGILTPRGVTFCYDIKSNNWALWGEYNESFPTNVLYGESLGFVGFPMKRDKINCSVIINPTTTGDSQVGLKSATTAIEQTTGGTARWYKTTNVGTWDASKPVVPNGTIGLIHASVVNALNNIFVIGGVQGGPPTMLTSNNVRRYEPANGANGFWTIQFTTLTLPTSMMYACMVMENGTTPMIYIYGGFVNTGTPFSHPETYAFSSTLYSLNPATGVINTFFFSTGSVLPPALAGGSAVYVPITNQMLILEGGGWIFNVLTWQWTYAGGITIDGSSYDPLKPLQRVYYGAIWNGETVYVFGGLDAVSGTPPNFYGTPVSSMRKWNMGGWGWITLTPMLVAVYSFAYRYVHGKIYVFGGILASGAATDKVQIYDIAADSWSYGTALPTVLGGNTYLAPMVDSPDGLFNATQEAYVGLYLTGGCNKLPIVSPSSDYNNSLLRYKL
mgnify:CR=1 FL=1